MQYQQWSPHALYRYQMLGLGLQAHWPTLACSVQTYSAMHVGRKLKVAGLSETFKVSRLDLHSCCML